MPIHLQINYLEHDIRYLCCVDVSKQRSEHNTGYFRTSLNVEAA